MTSLYPSPKQAVPVTILHPEAWGTSTTETLVPLAATGTFQDIAAEVGVLFPSLGTVDLYVERVSNGARARVVASSLYDDSEDEGSSNDLTFNSVLSHIPSFLDKVHSGKLKILADMSAAGGAFRNPTAGTSVVVVPVHVVKFDREGASGELVAHTEAAPLLLPVAVGDTYKTVLDAVGGRHPDFASMSMYVTEGGMRSPVYPSTFKRRELKTSTPMTPRLLGLFRSGGPGNKLVVYLHKDEKEGLVYNHAYGFGASVAGSRGGRLNHAPYW
jgi:hypothetical protein